MTHPLPPKAFYFIRHGESVWNTLNQFAGGQIDAPLTEKGIYQAETAISTFTSLDPRPTHIFHSTLSRARDTALILNRDVNCPMSEHQDLREIDAGDWAGIPNEEAKARWARSETPTNGENLDLFAKRIQSAFQKILNTDNCEMPCIVAHGRIINAIDHLYKISPRHLQVANCQISEFKPTGKGQYPWDVYIHTNKNGQNVSALAEWSQI